nr:hypothetical protein Q903MT_gene1642 [Picea sitchensis]
MAGTQYKAPRREVGYDHLAMRIDCATDTQLLSRLYENGSQQWKGAPR